MKTTNKQPKNKHLRIVHNNYEQQRGISTINSIWSKIKELNKHI